MFEARPSTEKGFTLIEILLVIALIAILSSITIVALNPTKQFGQAKDTTRVSHVNAILNAVNQYSLDNTGVVPSTIPTSTACTASSEYEICQTNTVCSVGVNLSVLTDAERYLVMIPIDPASTSTEGTGYNIVRSEYGRVTVCARNTDDGGDISVTR
jgi:prepilin-type N-terminal cleavage/methylation domain-containing protein